MIPRAEIQRIAAARNVDPTVIDHDHALGCFVHALAGEESVRRAWVFKGGTALAKCWFPDYRFSEDVDFTAEESLTSDGLHAILRSAALGLQNSSGIRTDLRTPSVETVRDEYGQESFEGKIYYQGIWQFRGDPRSIRIHVNRDELIEFQPIPRRMFHAYSDSNELDPREIRVYALEEVMVEKLRAFSGQRRFSIARDVFDIHFLATNVDMAKALKAFPDKCAVKGIDPAAIDIHSIQLKKEDYRFNWTRSLEYLLPQTLRPSFEEAWKTAVGLLEQATRRS